MAPVTKVVRCVTCQVEYTSCNERREDRTGKVCPNGHFHSLYELQIGRVAQRTRVAETRTEAKKAPPTVNRTTIGAGRGHQVVYKPVLSHDEMLKRLQKLSMTREESLEVACGALVRAFDQLDEHLAQSPAMSGMLRGTFEAPVQLAKAILKYENTPRRNPTSPA